MTDLDSEMGADRLCRFDGRGGSEPARFGDDGIALFRGGWQGVSCIICSKGELTRGGRFRAGNGVLRIIASPGIVEAAGTGVALLLIARELLDVTRIT